MFRCPVKETHLLLRLIFQSAITSVGQYTNNVDSLYVHLIYKCTTHVESGGEYYCKLLTKRSISPRQPPPPPGPQPITTV